MNERKINPEVAGSMIRDNKWYIVSTVGGAAVKVREALQRKQIVTYSPHYTYKKQMAEGYMKRIRVPLFKNWVFVYITEDDMSKVEQTRGVINFLYWLNVPAIISKQDIMMISDVIRLFDTISLEKAPVDSAFYTEPKNGVATLNIIMEENKLTNKIYLPTLGYYLLASATQPVPETAKTPVRHSYIREAFSLSFE